MALKAGVANFNHRSEQEQKRLNRLFDLALLGMADGDDSESEASVAMDSEQVQYSDLNKEYAAARGQVYKHKR